MTFQLMMKIREKPKNIITSYVMFLVEQAF